MFNWKPPLQSWLQRGSCLELSSHDCLVPPRKKAAELMAGSLPNCLVAAPKCATTPGNLPKAPALSLKPVLVYLVGIRDLAEYSNPP